MPAATRGLCAISRICAVLGLALLCAAVIPGASEERRLLFEERFRDLDQWKPLYFPKIAKHTVYSIESKDGEHYLRAESNASASGLLYTQTFNVYEYPKIRWSWKISNVYAKGDGRTKAGDDYPMRVYVLFEYSPEKAGAFDRIKYGIAKAIYGEYPPGGAITYVWSSVTWEQPIITSPHGNKVKVIALESGAKKVGSWQVEQVNILDDYRNAFGTDPPAKATLGIMNDSDDTGERAVSFMRFIEIYQ